MVDEFAEEKEYFVKSEDGNGYQPVLSPSVDLIETYYEFLYFKFPSSDKIEEDVTYYVVDYNTGDFSSIDKKDMKEADMLNYRVRAYGDAYYEKEEIASVNKEKFADILDNSDWIEVSYDKETKKFYVIDIRYSENKVLVYDASGTLVKELDEIEEFMVYDKLLNGSYNYTDGKTIIYNEKFDEIFEENMDPLFLIKYEDYVYYMYSYDIDGFMSFYNIREYKLLSEDNQTYNNKDIVVKVSGNLDNLKSVKVNDKELAKGSYNINSEDGSITLKKSYLNDLEIGTYTIKVEYNDLGYIESAFVISIDNPETFFGVNYSIVTLIISFMGLIFGILCLNKKSVNE